MPSAAQCPADDRIICTHRNMAEKDIEKLCLKERVDLSDKKQEQSGLQMRKRVLYLPCWTGRMCCLGSSRVLGGSLAWLRGGRVGRRSQML